MEKWHDSKIIKIRKNGISKEDVLVTIFSFVLFSSLISYQGVYSDVFDFDEPKNISSTPGPSQAPQIATLGPNVYVVWMEQDEIFFTRSDDDGVTFPFGINNLSNDPDFSSSQQMTAAGEHVYVVWQDENSGDQDIFFTRSNDNGNTFNGGTPGSPGTPINLSNDPDFNSVLPQIASVGNNVYVVWQDVNSEDDGIIFSASHNNENSFDVEKKNLSSSSSTGLPQSQQIAAAGDNVYVVWQDFNFLVPPTSKVFFSKSNDKGLTFSNGLDLNEPSSSSSFPQIAAAGDNVYVVWTDLGDEGNTEIFFSASHNKGNDFVVEKKNLHPSSSTSFPQITQIAAAGDNVYVVWQEFDSASGLGNIFIRASNNGGLDFGDPINLSAELGPSSLDGPQIAAVDDNVFVVWAEVSSIFDVFFASSTDGGGSFETKILSTPDFSFSPQIAVGSAHVIWQETTDNDEIFYNRGIQTPTSLTFDNLNYKLSDTATITLTGVPGPGPKSVTISSSADTLGFPLDLIETPPGTFTGTITFTTDSSDPTLGILKVKFGGSIHADFEGIDVAAKIFPRTVFSFEEYTLSSIAQVIVEDQNSNKKPLVAETITVEIKSDTDQKGISLDLKETEKDSGIFENKNLIFMTGRDLFSLGDTVTIVQKESDPSLITDNTINVKVRSTSHPAGIPTFELKEAEPGIGVFEGTLEFTSGPTTGNAIHVADGDIISVEYRDEIANGLIILNPDTPVNAIEAAIGDTITVTYLGASDTSKIVDSSGSVGRGGGGAIRPGLVLNAILGIFGGGSSGNSPSSFGTSSFAIISGGEQGFGGILNENSATTFDQTKTFKVGEKAELRFDFTQGGGIGKIEHIGLFTNIRDGQKKYDSDTYINYDPLKSPSVTVHDPNGLFSEANFELLQKDATNFVLKYDLTFAKPMKKSDFILESWNTQKWLSTNKIPNAIEVISSGIVQEQSEPVVKTFEEDVTNDQVIPVWVKTNAKWWSDGTLDNDNFISGIEYLVNEGIIKVSSTNTSNNAAISEIQPWIKNTAGWWADDKISDDEFVTAIQWLISNNIIQVV